MKLSSIDWDLVARAVEEIALTDVSKIQLNERLNLYSCGDNVIRIDIKKKAKEAFTK